VVAEAAGFRVELFARRSYPSPARVFSQVELAATWPASDLALLRVKAAEPPSHVFVLSAASPAVGAPLLAVGCGHQRPPYAAPGSFTGRPLIGDDRLQSSCPIVGGFSGGPLVDAHGDLVGVNVAHSPDGTTYSVPLDAVREFLQRERCVFLDQGRPPPGFANNREFLIVAGWLA
jgi:S1-C subfamily serine protease